MNQRKVKVPSATQAAMQDKTLRPPVKKESPPLGPALGKYKGFVEEQQKGEWGDMFDQLPTDEADVALMVAPFGSLSKPLQNFAKKLVQTKTVKEGVDVALRQITGLGMKAQDLVDFSKKLLDIQSTVPGGMEALKPKHFKALRLANEEVVGVKDRGRRSVEAGRHLSAPEGSPHPASGAVPTEPSTDVRDFDILGQRTNVRSGRPTKAFLGHSVKKDINQVDVDKAFDEAKEDLKGPLRRVPDDAAIKNISDADLRSEMDRREKTGRYLSWSKGGTNIETKMNEKDLARIKKEMTTRELEKPSDVKIKAVEGEDTKQLFMDMEDLEKTLKQFKAWGEEASPAFGEVSELVRTYRSELVNRGQIGAYNKWLKNRKDPDK